MNCPNARGLLSGLAAIVLVAPLTLAADPATTPNTKIMAPGNSIPGYTAGNVAFSPLSIAYGGAGWLMNLTMDGFIELVVAENGIGSFEGEVLIGGDVLASNRISIDSNASGRIAQHVSLSSPGQPTAVVLDGKAVLRAGDLVSAPGVDPFSAWDFIASIDLDDADHLIVRGEMELLPFPVNRDIIVRYDIDTNGDLQNPQVVVQQFDVIAGRSVQQVGTGSGLDWSIDSSGLLMASMTLAGAGAGDPTTDVIAVGDTILAEDGQPSILPGRDWQVSVSDFVELNAQGDHAFQTRVDGGPQGSLRVLVKNDMVLALEGAPAPGLPGTAIEFIRGPRMAENGSVMWWARWDNDGADREGFFMDDQLIVVTGDTLIDGFPLLGVDGVLSNWDIAEDGSRFSFEGFHQFGGWGVYEVSLAPWISLGGGLAGQAGVAPLASASGDLSAGSTASLSLSDALPGSTVFLVAGLSQLGLPFKGGTLCPAPDVILSGLTADGSGHLTAAGPWPAGVPSATQLFWQFWVADAAGPVGFAASNCLQATTP